MKKLLLIILIALSLSVQAQIPEHWYTTKIIYIFNPGTLAEVRNITDCFSELQWDGESILIEDCDDDRFRFDQTTSMEYNVNEESEIYYSYWSTEFVSGKLWMTLFYPADYTITFTVKDNSLMIIYY